MPSSLLRINHPHRNRRGNGYQPKSREITGLREKIGFTQEEMASLVYVSPRRYHDWETGDRNMQPAFWELINRKIEAGEHLLIINQRKERR